MSESMPIMANTAAASQSKDALGTGTATSGTETSAVSGDFTEFLDTQLQLAEEDVSAFPSELLTITDDVEALTTVTVSGNELPLMAANPGQAMMTPAEVLPPQILPPQNSAAASLQASRQPIAVKPLSTAAVNNESASMATSQDLNAEKLMNIDDMLMVKQQQHFMPGAATNRDNPLLDSALNQQLSSEAISQPTSNSSTQNLSNLAGLSAGIATKTDGPPGPMPSPLNVPPQHPSWNQSVGDRLQWMVGQNLQTAEIRLDPPELGSMEVRIQMNKDSTSIVFAAPNQQVRDALESAIPRLREMMDDIGLSLGDVNVSQESFTQRQQANEDEQVAANQATSNESEIDELNAVASVAPRQGLGMLDAYA